MRWNILHLSDLLGELKPVAYLEFGVFWGPLDSRANPPGYKPSSWLTPPSVKTEQKEHC